MNNLGTAAIKIVVLTGGAVLGTLLARWCDELLTHQAHTQAEFDKTRYAQGLTPLAPQPQPLQQSLPPLDDQSGW